MAPEAPELVANGAGLAVIVGVDKFPDEVALPEAEEFPDIDELASPIPQA